MSLLLSGPRLSHCDCQALGLAPPGDNLEAALGEPGPVTAAAAAAAAAAAVPLAISFIRFKGFSSFDEEEAEELAGGSPI